MTNFQKWIWKQKLGKMQSQASAKLGIILMQNKYIDKTSRNEMHSEMSRGPILTYSVKTSEFLRNKWFGYSVVFQHEISSSYSLKPVLSSASIAGVRTKIKPSTVHIS